IGDELRIRGIAILRTRRRFARGGLTFDRAQAFGVRVRGWPTSTRDACYGRPMQAALGHLTALCMAVAPTVNDSADWKAAFEKLNPPAVLRPLVRDASADYASAWTACASAQLRPWLARAGGASQSEITSVLARAVQRAAGEMKVSGEQGEVVKKSIAALLA